MAMRLAVGSVLVWLPGGFSHFVLPRLLLVVAGTLLAARARPSGRLPAPIVRDRPSA